MESEQRRVQLLGYEDFNFGMSEAEIRTQIRIADPQKSNTGGMWWKATTFVTFAGSRFVPRFLLKNGGLACVTLVHLAKVEGETCKGEVERLVGHLAKRYGPPDIPPAKQGQKEFYKAAFTFEDGGSIKVASFIDETNKAHCLDTVVYERSPTVSSPQSPPTARPW
jgi:hypothetical protein